MVESEDITQINLFLSARTISITPISTYCAAYSGNSKSEYFKSETIEKTTNPDWSTPMLIDFRFSSIQKMIFRVYNVSERNTLVGEVNVTLCQAVLRKEVDYQISKQSWFTIRAEVVKFPPIKTLFKVSGIELDRMDAFGLSDPYFKIKKRSPDGNWVKIYKSEIIKKTLDPAWDPFMLLDPEINIENSSLMLKFECYDWDWPNTYDFIGENIITVHDIFTQGFEFCVFKSEKKRLKNENSGRIKFEIFEILPFLQYIHSGIELNFTFAVDFSESNANLHSRTGVKSYYEQGIYGIGKIIENYDYDKKVLAFGFGATSKNESTALKRCFTMSGSPENPAVIIDRILDSYNNTFNLIKSTKESYLSSILEKIMEMSEVSPPRWTYNIVIIMTNGKISDYNQVVDILNSACSLPMSVFIIGMGGGNFNDIENLTKCEFMHRDHQGRRIKRNMVHFSKFGDFSGDYENLVKNMMKQVPNDVEDFVKTFWYDPRQYT
ncbi:hypothetical protein SteCoe_28240 [Stentor coeruleus]|uniref:C2 domain-containing protein n=1 Tax=Stentor coeruleus TaxID=5963 RepID=A0A1R2B8P3_9CILI|nr:hypothetical protein SteCoe_28240 [Stentor coeruleus]